MSFAAKLRLFWLLLSAALLGPLTGCTEFQSTCSNKWLDGHWMESSPAAPVSEMLTTWDNHVRLAEDSANGGMQRPGLVGRLFLLSGDSFVDAHGRVVVKMVDLTHPEPGQPPGKLGEWSIPAQALKQLKHKDAIGPGYTLYLPWPNYHPAVKTVELQVCYIPEKGAPRYSSPTKLTLQSADLQRPMLQERHFVPAPTIVPAALPPTPGWNEN